MQLLKYKMIFVVVFFVILLHFNKTIAASLNFISVTNNINQATVMLDCDVIPVYLVFSLHHPERIVIDILNVSKSHKRIFPIKFNGSNLIKCIRMNISDNDQKMRIVLDLIATSYIKIVKKEKGSCIILTILKSKISNFSKLRIQKFSNFIFKKINCVLSREKNVSISNFDRYTNHSSSNNSIINRKSYSSIIIVAIDAGHGGQDPGATSLYGIYEKNITINIAKKLKVLLNADPLFIPVMIRDGDYFLSVADRSDLARKKGANVLVSIHADSSINSNIRGASVWVLSSQRAKIEMMRWLQRSEKHSELLGGVGDVLTNYHSDPYFNHLVLDLQFGYSQRVGYDIALSVLHRLKNVSVLHKSVPEYSNFGVLRSPDIPSILVETGFVSNRKESYLLATNEYQEKIAKAIYKGLRAYFFVKSKNILSRDINNKNMHFSISS